MEVYGKSSRARGKGSANPAPGLVGVGVEKKVAQGPMSTVARALCSRFFSPAGAEALTSMVRSHIITLFADAACVLQRAKERIAGIDSEDAPPFRETRRPHGGTAAVRDFCCLVPGQRAAVCEQAQALLIHGVPHRAVGDARDTELVHAAAGLAERGNAHDNPGTALIRGVATYGSNH